MWKEMINVYNPYNSMKALAHRERIEAAVRWVNGAEENLQPPVTLTIDPTNLCNVHCSWCEYKDYRSSNLTSISDVRLLEIPVFLKEWGVKNVVLSGGEPLFHPRIVDFLKELDKNSIRVGIKTNGLCLEKDGIRKAVLKYVEWVEFSVDAATSTTYLRVKKAGLDYFDKVMTNIRWLAQNRGDDGRPKITMCFLIHHTTFNEQFGFCDLAKTMGADIALIRPIYLSRYRFSQGMRKQSEYYLREARKELEDETFHIYGIVHKVEREWNRAIRFRKCYATPLIGVLGADGKFHPCPDRRGDEEFSLGKWYPFEAFLKRWGSKSHRELLTRIVPRACPRCEVCIVNELVEKCINKDGMSLNYI